MTVHDPPLPGTCRFETTIWVPPAVAVVAVAALAHVPPTTDGVAIRKPAGKVSVNAASLIDDPPGGDVSVNTIVPVPPAGISNGLNALVKVA